MRDGHLLNEQMKMVRFLKSNKLAQNQVSSGVKRFFFFEKNFCQDQAHNRKNNRWFVVIPEGVLRVMNTKFMLSYAPTHL